jgi:DNA-binding XRE family transcriptional regulator
METTMGNRIAMLRRKKERKQDALAEMLGVSPQAVSKCEKAASLQACCFCYRRIQNHKII